MDDDVKLVAAFLALNAGVIALVFAGYLKGEHEYRFSSSISCSIVSFILRSGQAQALFKAAELKYG